MFVSCLYDVFCVFRVFIDRFVDFCVVPLSFSKSTSQYNKEEYISSLVTNFQISSCIIFRDIHVCILSIRCFLCVLHVLLTDSSIFARFHSVSRRITSQEKKEEYIYSVVTNFQISSCFIFRDIHVCMLSIRCFLCVLHVLLTDSSIFARFHSVSRRITFQEKKEEYIYSVVTNFQSSSKFTFRDIHVCILSIWCFLCILHVLLTDSSIFSRFHLVSRRITSQEKKEEYIPD